MFQINIFNRKPIYEQLIDQTERLILTGILTEEEQLPSVRSLSVELFVNPNTIQKAYAELDRRGLTYVIPGRGNFVSAQAKEKIRQMKLSQMGAFAMSVRELAMAGIRKEEVIQCVEEAYRKEGESA